MTCNVIPTRILHYTESKMIIIYQSTYFVYNLTTCAKEKVLPFNLFSSSFDISSEKMLSGWIIPPALSKIGINFLLHTFVIVTHVNTLNFYYGTWNLM